jgi:alpha-L-fucosidase
MGNQKSLFLLTLRHQLLCLAKTCVKLTQFEMKTLRLLFLLSAFPLMGIAAEPHRYFPDPDTAIQHKIEAWKDLKFGLLMHWGAYSQWSIVESWSVCPEDLSWATGARKKGYGDDYNAYRTAYEQLKSTFNPVHFNPGKWADAARAAGMKYVIFTTKHHDGFCMWDSKYTDYKITDPGCPFSTDARRDVTKGIFDAFRDRGFWTGAYFSKPDWHSDFYWWKKFPPVDRNANYSIAKYPEQWKQFVDYTHNQLVELTSRYGKVDILWLDGGWVRKKSDEEVHETLTEVYEGSRWSRNPQSQDIDMPSLVKKVRQQQPEVLVVDRDVPGPYQNYLTPEQQIPDSILPYPWETCMTMAGSWSYVATDKYKPAGQLIKTLVDVVSKGGNLLLNIGPGPDGEFAPDAYDRLNALSQWMSKNGEAIYATRPMDHFKEGDNVRFTQSKDHRKRYIFMLEQPDATFTLHSLRIKKGDVISTIGDKQRCKWSSTTDGVLITLPASFIQNGKHVWVLCVEDGRN